MAGRPRTDCPDGYKWADSTEGKKRGDMQCAATRIHPTTGKRQHCSYSCQKIDQNRLNTRPKPLRHQTKKNSTLDWDHNWVDSDITQTQVTQFARPVQPATPQSYSSVYHEILQERVAVSNLSFMNVTSQHSVDLDMRLINLGIKAKTENPNLTSATDVVTPIHATQLKVKYKGTADDFRKATTADLSHVLCSMVQDCGTYCRKGRLVQLCANPWRSDLSIFLANIVFNPIGDRAAYITDTNAGITAFTKLYNGASDMFGPLGISIVTADACTAQESALNGLAIRGNETAPSFYYIWCLCHFLHNLIANIKDKSTVIGDYLSDLDSVITFTRSKIFRAATKITCPTFSSSRWTTVYESLTWLFNHRDAIMKFLFNATKDAEKTLIAEYIEPLGRLFMFGLPSILPLYAMFSELTRVLEGDYIPASLVIPFFRRAEEILDELYQNFRPFLRDKWVYCIHQLFEQHLYKTEQGQILTLLYSLTLPGRAHLRRALHHTVEVDPGQFSWNLRNDVQSVLAELQTFIETTHHEMINAFNELSDIYLNYVDNGESDFEYHPDIPEEEDISEGVIESTDYDGDGIIDFSDDSDSTAFPTQDLTDMNSSTGQNVINSDDQHGMVNQPLPTEPPEDGSNGRAQNQNFLTDNDLIVESENTQPVNTQGVEGHDVPNLIQTAPTHSEGVNQEYSTDSEYADDEDPPDPTPAYVLSEDELRLLEIEDQVPIMLRSSSEYCEWVDLALNRPSIRNKWNPSTSYDNDDPLITCYDAIGILGSRVFKLEQSRIDPLKSQFRDWVKNTPQSVPLDTANAYTYWEECKSVNGMTTLACFALRIIVALASEAACERYFSLIKLTIPKYRSQTGSELEKAHYEWNAIFCASVHRLVAAGKPILSNNKSIDICFKND